MIFIGHLLILTILLWNLLGLKDNWMYLNINIKRKEIINLVRKWVLYFTVVFNTVIHIYYLIFRDYQI